MVLKVTGVGSRVQGGVWEATEGEEASHTLRSMSLIRGKVKSVLVSE